MGGGTVDDKAVPKEQKQRKKANHPSFCPLYHGFSLLLWIITHMGMGEERVRVIHKHSFHASLIHYIAVSPDVILCYVTFRLVMPCHCRSSFFIVSVMYDFQNHPE